MIKFFANRQITNRKTYPEALNFDGNLILTVNDVKALKGTTLVKVSFENCHQLANFSNDIAYILSTLKCVEEIRVQRSLYLYPDEVITIINSCENLKLFHFTPAWKRDSSAWITLYEEHCNICGADLHSMYLRLKYGYTSTNWLDQYSLAPTWAQQDLISDDSDSGSTASDDYNY